MVGSPHTFPVAHPLKGNINLLSEQGRVAPLQYLLTTFSAWFFYDTTYLGKKEDTKISLISGIYTYSDPVKVYFADYILTKPELESEQACDVKHILKNCCFIKIMRFY